MKKRLVSLLLSVAMVLSFAGCGGNGNSEADSGTSGGGAEDSIQESGENEVVWSSADQVLTLDNFNSTGSVYYRLTMLWGDSLFASDHEGNYSPWIATEWEWSDDYLTLTVKLRDDVKFINGEPLTAEDVKFTYERVVNSTDLTSAVLKGELESVDVIDDYTCQFNFAAPCARFMNESDRFVIICKSAYEADPEAFFSKAPVGSGAYEIVEYDPTTSIIRFERNDDWWGWTEENKSNVDAIVYRPITDTTSRVAALRAGEVDYIDDVPLDNLELLNSEGYYTESFFRQRPYYLFIHCPDGILADKNIREALSLCIDRQALCDSIIGGGEVATWPFSSSMIGYKETEGYEYNPEKAKELIAASGYNGEEITFMVSNSVHSRAAEIAQAIQSWAQEVGLNLKVEMLEQATASEKRRSGNYQIGIAGSPQRNGDAFNMYTQDFSRTDQFHTGYVNEELFEKLDDISQTVNIEERSEKL